MAVDRKWILQGAQSPATENWCNGTLSNGLRSSCGPPSYDFASYYFFAVSNIALDFHEGIRLDVGGDQSQIDLYLFQLWFISPT